jgi:hypothetical protein
MKQPNIVLGKSRKIKYNFYINNEKWFWFFKITHNISQNHFLLYMSCDVIDCIAKKSYRKYHLGRFKK